MNLSVQFLVLLSIIAGVFASPTQLKYDCPKNAHYEACGSACSLTCKNYKDPPKECSLFCASGCHCDKGYIWSGTGVGCILPEDCPPQKVCGENEILKECREECPLTCDNHDNPPKNCDFVCNNECECIEGFVRTSKGKCVKPEKCPPKKAKFCHEKPDPGMCQGSYLEWYYDGESKECKEFIYTGCVGNGNRFETKEECLETCFGRSLED